MGATAELLGHVVGQLDAALTKGPMPEQLVEALAALREARMTGHRDVLFYGARPVTPRVATALEDHAMELIASTLHVHPMQLAKALQRRAALAKADRKIAGQLTAPFDNLWSRAHHEGRGELERTIVHHSQGRRVVSIARTVALQAEIRAIPMSDLERADFEDALAICTDPELERQLVHEMWSDTRRLRDRLRRVRNAVNHGLPLDAITLNSIRDYSDEISRTALEIALTWFRKGEPGSALLWREENAWVERMDRIDRGLSWAIEDERRDEES